jgi:hypothetical protein
VLEVTEMKTSFHVLPSLEGASGGASIFLLRISHAFHQVAGHLTCLLLPSPRATQPPVVLGVSLSSLFCLCLQNQWLSCWVDKEIR